MTITHDIEKLNDNDYVLKMAQGALGEDVGKGFYDNLLNPAIRCTRPDALDLADVADKIERTGDIIVPLCIPRAFDWKKSPEGYEFWKKIYEKFQWGVDYNPK